MDQRATTAGTGAATAALRAARDQLLALRGDPARAAAEFTWPDVGPVFNWAHDWFDVVARGSDRPALVILGQGAEGGGDDATQVVTYEELRRRSDRVAVWLAGRGVRRGDPVLVVLGNQVELWEALLGLFKLGAVVLPTTTAIGAAGLRDRIARGRVRHVVCDGPGAAVVDEVPGDFTRSCVGARSGAAGARGGAAGEWADLREAHLLPDGGVPHPGTAPGDPLLHYFTSGTTAQPKLVEHSQVSYPVGHLTTMHWLGLQPGDVHLNISSPGWAKHAWSSLFAPFAAEATVVAATYRRFDAPTLLAQLRDHAITSLCAPPTVWRMLIGADLGERPAALRELVSAGEPLNPEVIEQVRRAWGATVRDGFGQTETTASVGNPPGLPVRPGSMGRPLPGVPVVVVDPASGAPVAAGETGEICLDLSGASGPMPLSLMTGYVGEGAVRGAASARDGLYRSGDLASLDADGYLTYVGRDDDVFKASDYKISPFEVESVLLEHPAVAEAGVVPSPDPVRLAVPKAYVALAAGHEPTRETALAVLAHARAHLAPWQRVRRLEFAELPKTLSGKIRRVDLRERAAALAAEQAAGAGSTGETGAGSGGAGAGGLAREWRDDEFPELRA